jgi:multiple sugar transport system substrate-binding protein
MIELSGITWNHTRGYVPMVATAQRFEELHPGVIIRWEKRTLQQFADSPVETLAEKYDLLVIDHPFVGFAAAHNVLLPLDTVLPEPFLAEQSRHAVGRSHASYHYAGHQWALATDTATPVSGFRPDLLQRAGVEPPRTWSELIALAQRGLVALPAIAIDSLMNVYMLVLGLGVEPFGNDEEMAPVDAGAHALLMLRELVQLCEPSCLDRNPIATWDLLAAGDSVAYCPFAYGYSNYARNGYAPHLLEFGGLVSLDGGAPLRSTLGGAGLAVSSRCRHLREAAEYCLFAAGGECQRSLYFDAGGQPGHRAAWVDSEVNRRCGGYFRSTLAALDDAWLRPRYDGYLGFQESAGQVVHSYLRDGGDPYSTMRKLNELYSSSRRKSAL